MRQGWLVLLLVTYVGTSLVRQEDEPQEPEPEQKPAARRHDQQHQPKSSTSCKKSEFQCGDGGRQCVGSDRYCNGVQDCENNADEPQDCSLCNRTYFGEVGRTYELEVKRPEELQLPFLCYLNFTAAGKSLGELVQLSFESFSVGTFESFTSEGCPDGYISIAEGNRPPQGGKWCGSSWGYTVYYSETPSINLTLHLARLPQQHQNGFEFKLSYKFLRLSDARIRYGNATQRSYRGKLHAGSYCDRLLEGCSKRPCRIQSPNYPGIYPRNLTCSYRVRDKSAPPEKHALIAVRQAHYNHKDHQVTKFDNSDRVFRIWDQCNVMQDYIEILDGSEQSSPILAHLCSGETVPEIISSGPELLVRFHTSPFGNPFHPLPLSYLPGFELEVQVFYVNKASPTYIEQGKKCEFLVSTFENPSGILESPMHSLPPNTTCHYHFRGHPKEIVWISFIKYHVTADRISEYDGDCDVQLQLWDGDIKTKTNVPLMGQFCKDDKPKLCDHSLLSNSSRKTRPCGLKESYVSSGSDLTVAQTIRYGNVMYPVSFVLRYEFVDLSQEGAQLTLNPCDRIFTSASGKFYSPRITFLYGRGGQKALNCAYHFEGGERKRLLINFERVGLGHKQCHSYFDPESDRWKCSNDDHIDGIAQIHVSEYPWQGVEIKRDCLCGNVSDTLHVLTKTGRKVVVEFVISDMNITEDYRDYYFDATYEFQAQAEHGCVDPWKTRQLKGSSGEITLRNSDSSNQTVVYCTSQPWLIEPENPFTNFLYLKIKGFEMKNDSYCGTRNRILVHAPGRTTSMRIICPDVFVGNVVELFSEGWAVYSYKHLQAKHVRSFIIEFLQREPGNFAVNWIEVSKNPALSLQTTLFTFTPPNCPHSCPELGACISPELWCDGLRHCPSGSDEQEVNCSMHAGLPLTVLTAGLMLIGALTVIILASGASLCFWRHRRREQKDVIVSVTEHTFLEFKSGYC